MRLRARFAQEALAALGIAVGVALLFASQVANTSLNGSVGQLTNALVGQSRLQLEARGPAGFPEGLLGEVQKLPGVRSAAPVLLSQARVEGPEGAQSVQLIGADPRFVRLGGSLLQHFSAATLARQHAIALPAPLADEIGVGRLEVVRLQVGASTIRVLLGAVLSVRAVGALAHSPVALAPLAYAQQLGGMPGRISRVFVQPDPGREPQVRAALTRLAAGRGVNVEPADYDATLFDNAASATDQSTAVFATISALVGFLFAFNAMLLTIAGRRALIVGLRLDGYSPKAVLEVLLTDALILGAISCLLGLVLGEELSLRLLHANPGYLSFAFPIGSQRIVTWQSVALAIAAGMFAACAGVLIPLREVLFDRPRGGGAARGYTPSVLLVLMGLACLAFTTATIVFSRAATVGMLVLVGALVLLLPGLLRGVLTLAELLGENVKARAPFLALAELRTAWARTVGIAATGAVAVFGSVAIQGARADLQRGLDQSARDVSSPADVWASPPGLSNLLATAPFAPSATRRLARLPDVRAVWVYRGGFLDYGNRRVWVSAQPTTQPQMVYPHQLVQGSLAQADRRVRGGGWAVVSRAIAEQHHLRIGQFFTLPAPHPIRLRIAALSTNVGWPPGAIIVNADDYAKAWESDAAGAYEIMTTPTATPAKVRREVQLALGPTSGLEVQTATERERKAIAASHQGLQRLSDISTLMLVAAVLAMASAMGNTIYQRRTRLAQLKLDGLDEHALWRTLLLESVLTAGSGCAIGALFGLYGQLLGSRAVLSVTGFPVVFSPGLSLALASLALVTTVAVAITAIPGYLVARVRPAVGLSS
jgi:putative ABC transport system permease protein